MKFYILIGLSFLTTQLMAAPLIYSTSDHLFHDHEKENLIYYIPKNGSLKLDAAGVPMFNMAYWGLEKVGPIDGELIATFELKESELQAKELDYYRQRGYEVRVLNYSQTHIIGERYYIGPIKVTSYINPKESFEIEAKTAFSQSIVDGHLIYKNGFTEGLFEFWYRVEGVTSFLKANVTLNDAAIVERLETEFGHKKGYGIEKLNIDSVTRKLMREKLITFQKEKGSTDHVETMIKNHIREFFFQVHPDSRVGKMHYSYTGPKTPAGSSRILPLYGRYNISEDMRILLSTKAVVNQPDLFNKI